MVHKGVSRRTLKHNEANKGIFVKFCATMRNRVATETFLYDHRTNHQSNLIHPHKEQSMTGQEFRDVLKANDFFLSDFATFVGKSRWWAQRMSARTKQVAPRWIIKLSEFLQTHSLSLKDFYPKVIFDDTNIEQYGLPYISQPHRSNQATLQQERNEAESE